MPTNRDTPRRVPTEMMKFWQGGCSTQALAASGKPTKQVRAARLSTPFSDPYLACAILRPMSHPPDLIHHGLEQARLALWAVINMTNAHLRPLTLRRSLKQKASGRLKQLEIIVRQSAWC